jgi:tRNA guanosine-2'-O-methyltransferase
MLRWLSNNHIQVVRLFESTLQNDYLNHTSCGAFHAQMEPWERILYWMADLWERGFSHENPQGEY